MDNKLKKRWEEAATLNLVPYTHGEEVYQVSFSNGYVPVTRDSNRSIDIIHREFKYIAEPRPANKIGFSCIGIQLTGIPCIHVLAVCRARNLSENQFVVDYYSVNYLLSTWNKMFFLMAIEMNGLIIMDL